MDFGGGGIQHTAEGLHEEGPGELGQVSWAGQRRVGEKPHISSRRNSVSRPFWQGGSRRFLRDSLRLHKVCECERACVWGWGCLSLHSGWRQTKTGRESGGTREGAAVGAGGRWLSGLIFVGLFLTFC